MATTLAYASARGFVRSATGAGTRNNATAARDSLHDTATAALEKPGELMWTDSLHDAFEQSSAAGADFCYVLQRLEAERPFGWIYVLEQAAQGLGCTVHEGLSFALEGDCDSPEDFEGVSFFFGDKLSSVMPVDEFVRLLRLASAAYVAAFPENGDSVLGAMHRVEARYALPRWGKPIPS